MKLKDICNTDKDIDITGISADSREIKNGFLFGSLNDDSYIEDAVKNGAKVIIVHKDYPKEFENVQIIRTENPVRTYAQAVAKYFGPLSLHLAAVTGTNGKTSIADFVRQLLTLMGEKTFSIGTLGAIKGFANPIPLANTTPNNVTLHKIMHEMQLEGFNYGILEASSHGLHQGRLDGVEFEAAGFTNLTRDHLDYHQTIENYFKAKMILFEQRLKNDGIAVLNADIECYDDIMAVCNKRKIQTFTYGVKGKEIRLLKATPLSNGQILDLECWGKHEQVEIPLAGDFQAANVMCALGLASALSNREQEVLKHLSKLKGAKGRMELVGMKNDAAIYIDYAHTPDALEHVLNALREHTKGRLKVLFGCGGNRDKGKRPIMGKIANDLADEVFVTDDNPRFENADIIRGEIMAACPKGINIKNRAKAIAFAMDTLKKDDVLLLAGKGHETGQYINGEILPFSDHDEVKKNL